MALPSASEESEVDEEIEDEFLVSNFDVNEFQFEIKEDVFGLGYKRLDVTKLFNQNTTSSQGSIQESPAASLLFPMIEANRKGNKFGMSGQAFGTGDFDDDEDIYDVYNKDSKAAYNYDLGGQSHTDQKQLLDKSYGFGGFENEMVILKRFIKSSHNQEAPKVFKGPEIPHNFDFRHKPEASGVFSEINRGEDSMTMYLKSASERASVLGEEAIKVDSVMDLMSSSDKEFLLRQREKQNAEKRRVSEARAKELSSRRYAEYIVNCRKGVADPYESVGSQSELTEWEKEKEREEFARIYQQQCRNISQVKSNNSKFVSSFTLNEKMEEVERVVESGLGVPKAPVVHVPEARKLTEEEQAALGKKYGALTRSEFEFRPHPTLCKRFNIPDPHPK